ncbi:MAG: transcriptional regulator [Actinomycetota bacterium]|nr:transcriptional regulator [Actinomycetota bacterium]
MIESGEHPSQRLDDTIHQRVRLGILAILAEADRAEFVYLRSTLALTDGNLSRHLAVLEEAGHVRIRKTFEGKKPRTWVQATPKGRRALAAELAALRDLLARFDAQCAG